jgi:hypothetical protein
MTILRGTLNKYCLTNIQQAADLSAACFSEDEKTLLV